MPISKIKSATVARAIVEVTESTMADFRDGVISGEESMTDRLVGAIRTALDGRHFGNLSWRARTLKTSRGKGAEEKRHGADVLGVLQVDLPEYKVAKGFLWQAKIVEPGRPMSNAQWDIFQAQCQTMLKRTPEAFAAIYSRTEGVRFIPVTLPPKNVSQG